MLLGDFRPRLWDNEAERERKQMSSVPNMRLYEFCSHSPRACTTLLARQCCVMLHDSAANAWQCRRCRHGHSNQRADAFPVHRSAFTLDSVLHFNHPTCQPLKPHDPDSPGRLIPSPPCRVSSLARHSNKIQIDSACVHLRL